ncbi:hypothetical protein QNO07_05050 [Streptomyces sp. 549]|uniref:hypothetical protein n=1 Tax=Streptomyces sp. 549 TaxID=3049076 RepID=UPI0024C25549|nr:hypothetical protein [Streptomyces sp. 549]MDK1472802.1 hypothetical protein [Streptomyces sp. 549]
MSRRQRFDPARLVLGLSLMGVAAVFLLREAGEVAVPGTVLVGMLPAALLLAGLVAAVDHLVRRDRRARGELGSGAGTGGGGRC